MRLDFLTATAVGTHVTLLGKVPSPKIIMKAFEEVKPNLIITVPLVIEKIYKKRDPAHHQQKRNEMGLEHSSNWIIRFMARSAKS